jgi:hypothetical protein
MSGDSQSTIRLLTFKSSTHTEGQPVMGKWPRIKIKSKSYRGVSGLPLPHDDGQPDERGLFDLRPMRFAALDGARATEILTELVNLPDDPDSPRVAGFIARQWDLALGGTDSGGYPPDGMAAAEVIRLRGLYRIFWEPRDSTYARAIILERNPDLAQDPEKLKAALTAQDAEKLKAAIKIRRANGSKFDQLKASLFMQLLGPDPRAFQSPISEMHGKILQAYLDGQKSIYPRGDYRGGALRFNWKTGALTIVARGPIDKLTHAVYQHRNRLRECSMCKQLFVAFGSNEFFCPFGCKLERMRERKRKDATGRRAALRVDGLTSRKSKPKRKTAAPALE